MNSRLLLTLLLLFPLISAAVAGAPDPRDVEARDALADRDWPRAVALFRTLLAERPDDEQADERGMLLLRALSLANDHAAVAEEGYRLLAARPESPFREKIVFLTAKSLLATDRGKEAADLASASIERLSGPELRALVARRCVTAADRAFAGRESTGPFDPGVPPDYARAMKLYGIALETGALPDESEKLTLRHARCAVETKDYARAIEILEDDDGAEALLLRGRAHLGLRDRARAADDFEKLVAAWPTSAQVPAALLFLGAPEHLERFVREFPDHPDAPRAAWREGTLLAAQGEVDAATAAFERCVSLFPGSPFAPRAMLASATALAKAGRFEEARGKYDVFLRRYPESADWAAARDALVEVWYRLGAERLAAKDPDAAARIWGELRGSYPLSPFAPRTLLEEAGARDLDAAARLLGEIVARYPKSPEAPRAALDLAVRLAAASGRIEEAVAALRKVVADYGDTDSGRDAARRLAEMQTESIEVELPAPLTPGAAPMLTLRTRNLERLEGKVYRIDPVAYFRKHGSLAGLDSVMVEVIEPDARFDFEVPEYERYRLIEGEVKVPVEGEGAWIVMLTGGDLSATGLLLVSGITTIVKESPGRVLAFVQSAADGAPVEGATVLTRSSGRVHEGTTGPDGTVSLDAKSSETGVIAFVGDSVALEGFPSIRRKRTGLATKVHVATDRSVYRPGHEVRYRAVVRRAAGERRVTPAGEAVLVTVTDGAGNELHRLEGSLGAFGTASGAFALPDDLPPGDYDIVLRYRKHDYPTTFHVEAYRKPQIFLAVTPERPVYVRGEEVVLTLSAAYAFGPPVPDLPVRVEVYSRAIRLEETRTTDARGQAELRIGTTPGPDLTLTVRLTARDATGRLYTTLTSVPVAAAEFAASVSLSRDELFTGEDVRVLVRTANVLGDPVAARGKVIVGRAEPGNDEPMYANWASLDLVTGEDGVGHAVWRADRPGRYRFRFVADDRAGREVAAVATATVAEREDRVFVRADRPEYHVGDTAKIRVVGPGAGWALLTWEGASVYGHRVVRLEGERSEFEIEVAERFVPDVWFAAALGAGGRLLTGDDHVRVGERVDVTIEADRDVYRPGESCRIVLTTFDARGEPVPAEVALSVVDEAVFRIRADETPALAAYFRPPDRTRLVRTGSSFGFRYQGVTEKVPEELRKELARRELEEVAVVRLEEKSLEENADLPFDGTATNSAIGIGGGAGGAFGGRGGHRNLRAEGGGAATGEQTFTARKKFRDTAFFRADVVTDAEGRAVVEFTLPDDLTEWRITARAASRGNAFGERRSEITTSRPLVVRAALPRFLREGDSLVAGAGVVNATGEAQRVTVALSPARDAEAVGAAFDLAASAETVTPWPLPAASAGVALFRARATAEAGYGDEEERSLVVKPYGTDWRTGFAGESSSLDERSLDLPDDAVPGTAKLRIHVAPSITRVALDGVAELQRFPYGCVEQTVNRFYPALEIAAAIRRLGIDDGAKLPRLAEIARSGVRRLTYLQRGDGLWGWWRSSATDPEMTAYALLALAGARDAGIAVPPAVFERAGKGLGGLLGRVSDPDARAFLLLAASQAGLADLAALGASFADRRDLSVRGLAHLLLAFEPFDAGTRARLVAEDLRARLAAERSSDVETLGWALAALAGLDGSGDTVRELAVDLVKLREGDGFGTTRRTGAAVAGLARVLGSSWTLGEAREVRVALNGEVVFSKRLEAGDGRVAGGSFAVPADRLLAGRNRLSVTSPSGGSFFYALSLTCVRRGIPESSPGLGVARTFGLVPKSTRDLRAEGEDRVRPRASAGDPVVDTVRMGEVLRVRLRLQARDRERFAVIECPLPAGFESIEGSEKGAFSEAVRMDDRMVFFLENVAGASEVSFLMQGEMTGEVRVPPAVGYAMYRPRTAAWSGEGRLRVVGADEPIDRDPTAGLDARGLLKVANSALDGGRFAEAARFLEALLDRYELPAAGLGNVLRKLARARLESGDPAGAVEGYDRLRADVRDAGIGFADEMLLADALRRLDRHGEAISAMERAATALFGTDRRLPELLGDEALLRSLLDRYPFLPVVGDAWTVRLGRLAAAFEAALAKGDEPEGTFLDETREFLARWPASPFAPTITIRMARAWLRSGRFEDLYAVALRFGDRYPDHHLRDDADWFACYALFGMKRYDEAETAARAAMERRYRAEDGKVKAGAYGKNLIHLLAQSAHIAGRLDEAVALYRRIEDWSQDARAALRDLTAAEFSMEGTTRVPIGAPAAIAATAKNLSAVDVTAYPIDLLITFALKQDVTGVAALNLDGLPPAIERRVELPGAGGRRPVATAVDLGVLAPGAYLVIVRSPVGERRGLVLVTDLEARIRRHGKGAQVIVGRCGTGEPVAGALVKLAAGGRIVAEGRTDARGIFDARGEFRGRLTAVAAAAPGCTLVVE